MTKKNKSNRKEKENAVTLIALVVTIVVLIILAGISINSVIGENGLIKKGKKLKQESEKFSKTEEERRKSGRMLK